MMKYLCLPPTGSGDILFFPVRPSVRPSVCHKSCPLYNLKTVKDFSMKLGTLVNHDETMCHAQESLELFPFDYFSYNFVSAL